MPILETLPLQIAPVLRFALIPLKMNAGTQIAALKF